MAVRSFEDFINDLQRLEIDEVQVRLETPPTTLPTANLPASWVGLPSGAESARTFQTPGFWTEITVDLNVALVPMGQSTHDINYEDTVRMMDNVRRAIKTTTPATDLGKAAISWTMEATQITVADSSVYWGVVTTITGFGGNA